MKTKQRFYHSYLLRIWKEILEDDCRASLQDVITGDCHYFASLPALMGFLQSISEPVVFRPGEPQEKLATALAKK